MTRRRLKTIFPLILLGAIFAGLLFSSHATAVIAPDWLQSVAREIQAACRDAGTQWMVVVCLVSYFVVFLFLETKTKAQSLSSKVTGESDVSGPKPEAASCRLPFVTRHLFFNPDFWLCVFVVLGLLRYAFDYANATRSLQVAVLLTGIVVGKGVALWVRSPRSKVQSLKSGEASLPSSLLHLPYLSRRLVILHILTLLLAAAALWHPERGMEFQYRGQVRWTGPWDNPNLYGVLMGVGTILALGLLVSSQREKRIVGDEVTSRSGEASLTSCPKINYQPSTFSRRCTSLVTRHTPQFLLVVVAGLCAYGLLKSYSRGAWLGTAVGLAFLLFQVVKFQVSSGGARRVVALLRRNWFPSSILLFSILVLSFWQFRHTEAPLLRRVFSVGNPNDFSWRNRVTAWQGAGRMMRDKPLAGFGWGKAEEIYSKEYRAARLEESAAIQMNDFFMLGISAGVPALMCLFIYLWLTLSLRKREVRHLSLSPFEAERESELSTFNFQLSTAAKAGAVVLLVGFWFDGGLFKLPTAVVFWVLLELCRRRGDEAECLTTMPAGGASVRASRFVNSLAPPTQGGAHGVPRPTLTLRWLAGIFAIIALGLTVLHLGTPQLAVNERTLSLARKFLVPPQEKTDFEFLAAKPVWSDKRLKTLLQHAHLANYNRSLVNWKLDDSIYQQFVLSPEIDPAINDLNWRRPLWEYFYPRIRKENSPETAAGIVIRHLRERVVLVSGVTTSASPDGEKGGAKFPSRWDLWWQDPLDAEELELVGIAALRAVGIPARLTDSGRAEYWTGEKWEPAFR